MGLTKKYHIRTPITKPIKIDMVSVTDIQDWEDYSQFRAYMRLRGCSSLLACQVSEKHHRHAQRREEKLWEAYKQKLSENTETDPILKMVLFPESPELSQLPPYDRYIAGLLSKYTREEAAEILGMNRMGLYRWLKSNDYINI